LKPAVVFFGETVPRRRVERAFAELAEADAVLVVGSSLQVYSGYRFVRAAVDWKLPVALLNLGRTRADDEVTLKVEGRCGELLPRLAERLGV
jgi:NAD-dependent SIR2 family protein deacetylase